MRLDHCLTSCVRAIVTSTVLATVGVVALAGSAHAGASASAETAYSRPCFMVRAHWNVALDGPQPLCPVPSSKG